MRTLLNFILPSLCLWLDLIIVRTDQCGLADEFMYDSLVGSLRHWDLLIGYKILFVMDELCGYIQVELLQFIIVIDYAEAVSFLHLK